MSGKPVGRGSIMTGFIGRVREEFRFVKGNLLILIISWALFNFGFMMAFPFETPYIRGLGASPFVIGLIGSLGYLVLTIVRIPGSYIADRYGRKQIIVVMTFAVAFSYLFYVFAPDWRTIVIGAILINTCLIYQPALEAITADSIPPEKRGIGFAMTRVIPNIPTIFSPLIAGYIVSTYNLVPGMRIVYLIMVILSLVAATVRFLFLEETIEEPKPIKFSELKTVYRDSIKSIIKAWKTVPRNLKILTLILMLSSFEDPVFTQFSALYVFDVIRVSDLGWGMAMTAFTITTLLAGIPLGKVSDVIGRKNAIILAYIIFIPSTIFFIVARSFLELVIIMVAFGMASMMIGPAFQALITDMVPKNKRGRIIGVIGSLNTIMMIPTSAIAGYLYQLHPSYPFQLLAIAGVIMSVTVYLFIKEPEKREQ